jgi:hypothetical protein
MSGLNLSQILSVSKYKRPRIPHNSTHNWILAFKNLAQFISQQLIPINLKTAVTQSRQHDFQEADARPAEQFRRGRA